MYKACIRFPEFCIFSCPSSYSNGWVMGMQREAELPTSYCRTLCTAVWETSLTGYPICTHIRCQRCRIRKSGFVAAYCHNLLINLHCKCEMYPLHDKNICSQGFRYPDTVTVFVALYAGNRCNREHVGRHDDPCVHRVKPFCPCFRSFFSISISFRIIIISNSIKNKSASNLILHHWTIMSIHILVQLLYLDSNLWIKYIIVQFIRNFPPTSCMQYISD